MSLKMIKTILFTLLLTSASFVSAGNAKILKLTPLRYKVGMGGIELIVSVQFQMTNVTSTDCGCIIFLNDKCQPANNLEQIEAQFEDIYYGEEAIEDVQDSQLKIIEVCIPVDVDFLKKVETGYLQAFILDVEGGGTACYKFCQRFFSERQ